MSQAKLNMEKKVVAKSPYEEYTEMQVKAAFEVFDEDQNGRAKFKHLGTILRALGRVVTNTDIQAIGEKLKCHYHRLSQQAIYQLEDQEYPKYMRLEALFPVASKLLLHDNHKSASTMNLLQAFRKLDRQNKGYIDADYLKRVMKENGDKLSEGIVEKFISDSTEDGTRRIKYKEICEKLAIPHYFDIADNRRKIRLELSRESSRAN